MRLPKVLTFPRHSPPLSERKQARNLNEIVLIISQDADISTGLENPIHVGNEIARQQTVRQLDGGRVWRGKVDVEYTKTARFGVMFKKLVCFAMDDTNIGQPLPDASFCSGSAAVFLQLDTDEKRSPDRRAIVDKVTP